VTTARFVVRGLSHAPGRALVRLLVLAAAAGLLCAMVLFVGHSLRTMTGGAVRSVPLDWQAPVSSAGAARRVAAVTSRDPAVVEAAPVATAPFAGIVHRAPVGTIRAGAGALLAVPPGYTHSIHVFRFLRGGLRPGHVVLDQQLAATLQAQPGDTILLRPSAGRPPVRLTVSGIALATSTDVLFQPLNPLLGPAPAQPPSNVAIVPLATFEHRLAPLLPAAAPATPSSSASPGAAASVQWQVQAQLDPAALRGSPSHALTVSTRIRNRVERQLTGKAQFVDNLGDSLSTAAGDALYAETLFIMLAVPGALIGLGLAYVAALGAAERERRELALLRARGASRRRLVGLAAAESVALGIPAGVLGALLALGALRLLVPNAVHADATLLGAAFGTSVLVAVAGALAARLAAGAKVLTRDVAESRRSVQRGGKPLWERLYLDVAALVGSGLVYWLTARTGFSAVINPDSNPTRSLCVYMFLAPALLWVGAALLLIRLRGRFLAWLAAGKRASTSWGFVLASAGRRSAALNRGLLLVGLLLAFGVELALFTATYDQQARVDAQLTLGADVVATAPPGAIAHKGLERTIAHVTGVSATSAVDHGYAYVGPDLQDVFGIDPRTISAATGLRDSYFLGGSATTMLGRLRARPDAILVSLETINDYSLQLGDLLELRVLDHASGRYRVHPFHVAGVVQEFPSAPRDSFMVANLAYLERIAHDQGPNVVFAKASDPVPTASRVSAATASAGTSVKDIGAQAAQTVSAITTVDLGGISRIEEAFALVLAAGAMLLLAAVALEERRHELATMAALGASLRTIGSFLWSEAAIVLAGALALAALLGWLLAEMLVAMLRHVFDPPPDHLAAPWGYLAALGLAALGGAVLSAALSTIALKRASLGAILREE